MPSDEIAEGATLWSPEGLRHLHHGAPSTERITVYNLEVEGFHTYFVGKLHTWVHNRTENGCGDDDDDGTIENRHGGGKNAQHANAEARKAAQAKWEAAKEELAQARARGATKAEKQKIQKQIDHWKKKMDFVGENHSRKSKR